MKIRLPLIGTIATGKDINQIQAPQEKGMSLGGFLDLGTRKLSSEKSVSTKLIEAYAGWVYVNSSVLAEEVSRVKLKLYQTRYSGGQLEMAEVETHELLDLLDRFNDSTTSSDGFYLTESHLNLTGDSFWYLAGGYKPKEIFILRPDKMSIGLGDVNDASRRLIEGYTYKETVDGKVIETKYTTEEILPIKVPSPKNPYRGFSTVEAIANDIDTDNYAGVTLREFFENGMIVQFALSTEQRLNNDQIQNFQSQLKSAYGGTRNAWKVPIFGGGVKPVELQMSSKDMELLKQMEWLRNKIMVAFKNTPASLGIVEDVNRANAESSILTWKQTVIEPKIKRIVDSINEFLVPRYGDNLVLGFESVVPEDESRNDDRAIALFKAGLITKNEGRAMIEYDDVKGGDEFDSSGFRSVLSPDNLPKAIKNINWQRAFRKQKIFDSFKSYKAFYKKTLPIAIKYVKSKNNKDVARPTHGFTDESANKYASNQLKIVDHHEQIFQGKLEQIINGVVNEAISNINNQQARKTGKLIDKDKWLEESVSKLEPTLAQVAVLAGNEANKLIGIDNPYIPKAIKEVSKNFIREQILLFMGSALDTDVDIMTEIIASGLTDELSVPEIRRAIESKFIEFSKSQAEVITRTEVIKTSNFGAQDAFEQSGVVEGKQWLATADDRTDEDCLAMDGQIVDLDGDYDSSIEKLLPNAESILSYSSVEFPPLHPNCRCVLLPVIVGEKSKLLPKIEELNHTIELLELKVDKRTKQFRDLKQRKLDPEQYMEELEKIMRA